MQHNSDTFVSRSTIVTGLLALVVVGLLIIAEFYGVPQLRQLRFNAYALISATSFAGTSIVLLRMIFRGGRSDESKWFMLILLALAIFSGGEALQRLSAEPVAAIFWSNISSIGVPLGGVALYLFAVAYAKPDSKYQAIITTLLIVTSAIVIMFYVGGNLIYDQNLSHIKTFAWGFNNLPGRDFAVPLAWTLYLGIISTVIIVRFRNQTQNQLLKKQSTLFAIAILIPLIGGLAIDGFLPLIGIDFIPPLASFFEFVMSVIIYYGISNYQLFQINPSILAENVLTTMQEGVVVTRADFAVEYINKEAERLLGLENTKLTDKTFLQGFFAPESWAKVHEYVEGKMAASDQPGDVSIQNSRGEKVPVRVFASQMKDDSPVKAYVFVISDITDIVATYDKLENNSARISHLLEDSQKLEHQLEQEKSSIEQLIDVRTRELQDAQQQLKGADKMKSEFIMLASHSLRTPITVMASGLEMVENAQSDEERKKFVDSIKHGMTQLKNFVEDMVLISSIEAGDKIQRQSVTVRELLDPIVADYTALVLSKEGVEFTTQLQNTDTMLSVNTIQIQGAIRNLVGNAFKFTAQGTIILSTEKTAASYVFKVKDSGIGIAPDQITDIFTKFHRATDTLQFSYEGEGIGLYLTKLIIEKHGGKVYVQSTPGQGSEFIITLPLEVDAPQVTVQS